MSTPEAKVKQKVKKLFEQYGVYYFMPATGGFGRSGVPDFIACCRGKFIGVECKAGSNQPTALQERELRRIIDAGGAAFVVNEESIATLAAWLAAA